MRTIPAAKITETVARLCQQANYLLPRDVQQALSKALHKEDSPRARDILTQISDNARVAQEKSIALCQDTGIAEVFVNLGQDAHIEGEILQKVQKDSEGKSEDGIATNIANSKSPTNLADQALGEIRGQGLLQ